MRAQTAPQRQLKRATFYGREKESLIYPIALANLVLHGIDEPHVWHGNTLAERGDERRSFSGRSAVL